MDYYEQDQKEYERRDSLLRQTPGCTCQVRARNFGTAVSEMWVETYGCVLHDEQYMDFNERQAEMAAIPGCLCRVQAVNMGTPYYRTQVAEDNCPVHGN